MNESCLHCHNKNIGCRMFCNRLNQFTKTIEIVKRENKIAKAEKELINRMKVKK